MLADRPVIEKQTKNLKDKTKENLLELDNPEIHIKAHYSAQLPPWAINLMTTTTITTTTSSPQPTPEETRTQKMPTTSPSPNNRLQTIPCETARRFSDLRKSTITRVLSSTRWANGKQGEMMDHLVAQYSMWPCIWLGFKLETTRCKMI